MTIVSTLESRYRDVLDRAAAAAQRAGRPPEAIHVVAVCKYAELDDIRELIRLGHRDFGESRVQQLAQRAAIIDEHLERSRMMRHVASSGAESGEGAGGAGPIRWHMIGHLQRNKVAKVIPHARLIQSVDSLRLVEEIQAYAMKRDIDVDVLVQVNCSGEGQKYGCAVAAAQHLCEQIDLTGNVHIRGLMTMAPLSEIEGGGPEARSTFERCREVYDDIAKKDLGDGKFNILSMGMTGDFETAIECGANVIRVGSGIFGEGTQEQDDADRADE